MWKRSQGIRVVKEGEKFFREAKLLFFERKFEESLECSRKAHQISARNDSYLTLPFLVHNLHCYYRLGDKQKCEKMIKRIKRIKPNHETARAYEQIISSMRRIPSVKRKTDKICGKCCYPFCDNFETTLGEFQICSQCRRTKYCNFSLRSSPMRNFPKRKSVFFEARKFASGNIGKQDIRKIVKEAGEQNFGLEYYILIIFELLPTSGENKKSEEEESLKRNFWTSFFILQPSLWFSGTIFILKSCRR